MRTEAKPLLAGSKVKWTLEQQEQASQARVRLDWLRFTVPLDAVIQRDPSLVDLTAVDLLDKRGRDLVRMSQGVEDSQYTSSHKVAEAGAHLIARLLDCGLHVGPADRGMDFYTARAPLIYEGETVGMVLAGSKDSHQASTVHVNLFGSSMLHIPVDRFGDIREYLCSSNGVITRADLSVDVWTGHDVADIQTAYKAGDFMVRGKQPTQREIGSWTLGHSRTFEVGSRATGKLFRGYEKGDQLFGHEAGDPWIRYEVELRNNHRVIDLDVLTRPADFFAGAYQFCADLLDRLSVQAEACRIPTNPELVDRTADAAVTRVCRWIKRTAAPALVAALKLGGDVLESIVDSEAHRVPKRLKGISGEVLRSSFQKVAEALAPAPAPSFIGAV